MYGLADRWTSVIFVLRGSFDTTHRYRKGRIMDVTPAPRPISGPPPGLANPGKPNLDASNYQGYGKCTVRPNPAAPAATVFIEGFLGTAAAGVATAVSGPAAPITAPIAGGAGAAAGLFVAGAIIPNTLADCVSTPRDGSGNGSWAIPRPPSHR
jgi:hypothetical protein